MEHRFAGESDLDLLAEWNHQLIRDEGHNNPMTVPELRERMRGWLETDYRAVLFSMEGEPLAYALYREGPEEIYLRQFFVRRDRRRRPALPGTGLSRPGPCGGRGAGPGDGTRDRRSRGSRNANAASGAR